MDIPLDSAVEKSRESRESSRKLPRRIMQRGSLIRRVFVSLVESFQIREKNGKVKGRVGVCDRTCNVDTHTHTHTRARARACIIGFSYTSYTEGNFMNFILKRKNFANHEGGGIFPIASWMH